MLNDFYIKGRGSNVNNKVENSKNIRNHLKMTVNEYKKGRDPNEIIALNAESGEIRVRSSLDREKHHKHQFEVCARDMGRRVQLVSKPCARIDLTLLDLNDNKPQFYLLHDEQHGEKQQQHHHISHQHYFYLEDNSTENSFVAWLKAFDTDLAENGTITYTLDSTAATVPFWIDPHGIVRNSRRIRIIDDSKTDQLDASSTSNVYFTRQRTFVVKVTATDSSKGIILIFVFRN